MNEVATEIECPDYQEEELFWTEDCDGYVFATSQLHLKSCIKKNIEYNDGTQIIVVIYEDLMCEEEILYIHSGKTLMTKDTCIPFNKVRTFGNLDQGWGYRMRAVNEPRYSQEMAILVVPSCQYIELYPDTVEILKRSRYTNIFYISEDTCMRDEDWGDLLNLGDGVVSLRGSCTEGRIHAKNFTLKETCENFHYLITEDFCSDVDYYGLYFTCIPYYCDGKSEFDVNVCSSSGRCISSDVCECEENFSGDICQYEKEENEYSVGALVGGLVGGFSFVLISGLILLLLFLFILCVICVCLILVVLILGGISTYLIAYKQRMRRLEKLTNLELSEVDIDMIVSEKTKPEHLSHLKINKELFLVDFEKIRIIKKIGEGGSNSIVFKASHLGQVVAFKCFRTRDLCSSEAIFSEFEREVEILCSLHHKNVLQFYGASLKEPRVGILMEFCEFGDLRNYMETHQEISDTPLQLHEKMRYLKEISSAMRYLHASNVIHRDLKPENVLVTSNFEMKIMDFGVSKLIEKNQTNFTKRIGTSFYMAPEVTRGEEYNETCDVFAYSIMLIGIITNNFKVYGAKYIPNIEFKVAQNQNFRPVYDRKVFNSIEFLEEIMIRSWSSSPSERPSFQEIDDALMEYREKMKNIMKDDGDLFNEEDRKREKAANIKPENKMGEGKKEGVEDMAVERVVDSEVDVESELSEANRRIEELTALLAEKGKIIEELKKN